MAKILVIEDDLPISTLISIVLRKSGHSVVGTCGSSEEGLQFLQSEEDVDLVLLDVYLPGESGISLLERLRGNDKWNEIPVIIMTAKADPKLIAQAKQLGVKDFLCKPFNPSELVDRVDFYLDPRQQQEAL